MAIQASPGKQISSIGAVDCAGAAMMGVRFMTFLTKKGGTYSQQIGCCGSMRIMAKRTILLNRWMIANKRPAFFHVAGITGVIHTVLKHFTGASGAMRIMAIRANYLTFPDGVAGRPVNLCTLFFMTGKTDFCLKISIADFIPVCMNLMTGGTGDVAIRMCAAGPMHPLAAQMTVEAGAVSVLYGVARVSGKSPRRHRYFVRTVDVSAAPAMATGTGWCEIVGVGSVHCFANSKHGFPAFVMTTGAGLITAKKQRL